MGSGGIFSMVGAKISFYHPSPACIPAMTKFDILPDLLALKSKAGILNTCFLLGGVHVPEAYFVEASVL
ncbi:MAG TPA: hypothetical protein DCY88_15990 [Cyanobacteria bacterium UBA11372]|nr:hypothetical protein [Cyanobacteria bacterium UBA11372]